MADIRHREPSRRGHEVVIFQIGRQIELGARTQGFAEERPAGTGTNRHAAHPFAHDPAVAQRPDAEPPPRLAQIVERRHGFGQLAHHAETHPLALVGRRRQHTQRTDSQLGGQPPAHAVRGTVQVGVAGVERDVPAHGPRHAPLHVIGFVESFERMEDDRMMRHDEVATLLLGFGEHLLGHVHGQQGTADLPFGIAHHQTGIVVFLLQRKRRETLDRVGYLLDFHGQKSDCS